MDTLTNKERGLRTFNAIKKYKKNKEYKDRLLQNEITDIRIKGVEKTMRRRIKQT